MNNEMKNKLQEITEYTNNLDIPDKMKKDLIIELIIKNKDKTNLFINKYKMKTLNFYQKIFIEIKSIIITFFYIPRILKRYINGR